MYKYSNKVNSNKVTQKVLSVFLALALAIAFVPVAQLPEAQAQEDATEQTAEQTLQLEKGTYDESQVIVKFKDSVESSVATDVLDEADSVKSKGEAEVEEIADNTATVKVEDGKSVEEAIDELESDDRVEFVEPDYKLTLFDDDEEEADAQSSLSTTSVNDPWVTYQWHISDSYSKVKEAWDIARCNNNSKVTVAIVDSGIDTDHPDLKSNIIGGYSVVDSNTSNYEDSLGHGTKVAGIISGRSNNSLQGTGVSYNANILSVKVTDDHEFFTSKAVDAINWVVKNKSKYNVKVINLSLGSDNDGSSVSKSLVSAVESAWNNGILCVAASGNNGTTSGVSCPASSSATLSVGAVDDGHNRAYYSNGGSDLDVVAPGSDIYTTLLSGQFGYGGSGTSFAAPFISGVVALCFASNTNATPSTVKSAITSTAKDLGTSGKDIYYGYGQVVAKDAVAKVKTSSTVTKVTMFRLYNPNSGEHFYTSDTKERAYLLKLGWKGEGSGWTAPSSSNTPVYRLYNPNAGDHHYTTSLSERNWLVSLGWRSEGTGWYSDDSRTVKIYRQYNPNAIAGAHNFTASLSENNWLVSLGWTPEGIAWYGIN